MSETYLSAPSGLVAIHTYLGATGDEEETFPVVALRVENNKPTPYVLSEDGRELVSAEDRARARCFVGNPQIHLSWQD